MRVVARHRLASKGGVLIETGTTLAWIGLSLLRASFVTNKPLENTALKRGLMRVVARHRLVCLWIGSVHAPIMEYKSCIGSP